VTDAFDKMQRSAGRAVVEPLARGGRRLEGTLGGPARTKVILMLASVLGLDTADKGATSALAAQLQVAFHINTVEIGLLIAVSSLVGAVFTLPLGVLADRSNRKRVLWVSILIWSVAEAASGLAVSYLMLVLTRVALGIVTATAAPTIASLVGDLFPPRERGRIYGFILTGELIGSGIGVVIAGDIGAAAGWQWGYVVLAVPSLVLAWVIRRGFTEPARGGQSRLEPGAVEVLSAEEVARGPNPGQPSAEVLSNDRPPENLVLRQVREAHVQPDPGTVIHGDPTRMGMMDALRWVLKVRTNVVLIVSSALGYFFLGGVRSFAIIFFIGYYGISQSSSTSLVVVIGAAAVVGVLVLARLSDAWLERGKFDARMILGAACYVAAAAVFIPGLLTRSLAIALPIFAVAALFLGGSNPEVDAARLDVVPSRMWGRAEAIRTFLRNILEAAAPLVFGYVAVLFGAGAPAASFGAGVGAKHPHVPFAEASAIDHTFLVMLVPLALAGVLLVVYRRRYPTDVASAGESEEESAKALAAAGEDRPH
jgi:MFS family permease